MMSQQFSTIPIYLVFWGGFFSQKSKDEKKKKKKHKHEEKGEDLLGGQADEPVVQSEETNEVTAPPTSTSAEVCVEQICFLPSNSIYLICTRIIEETA